MQRVFWLTFTVALFLNVAVAVVYPAYVLLIAGTFAAAIIKLYVD